MEFLPLAITDYVEQHCSNEDELLKELTRETFLKIPMPRMLSGHQQGLFLEMISRLNSPKRILEIGTYTGYSAICLAKGLADDGLLYTIDINEELSEITNNYFTRSGFRNKIISMVGNAVELIPTLKEEFDLVFIDADKQNYSVYYDLVFDKVKTGGFIIADNVLWSGKVVEVIKDKDTQMIDEFNKKVSADARVTNFIAPIRDGLMICRKIRS